MVKVSVIIPVYNVQEYLGFCLDSVCSQTLKDIEIICIDDGSTDKSGKILAEYAAKDPRFIIIKQENKGQSAARNAGIKKAKGEYLSFVDSDDWINDIFLEKLYTAAVNENVDVCGCGFKRVKSGREKVSLKFDSLKKATTLHEKFCLFDMPRHNYVWNKIYRRDMIIQHQLWFAEGRYYEDMPWSSDVMEKSQLAIAVPDAWYFYRYNLTSIVNVSNGNPKKEADLKWGRRYQRKFMKRHHLKIEEKCQHKTKLLCFGICIGKIATYPHRKKIYIFGIKVLELRYS